MTPKQYIQFVLKDLGRNLWLTASIVGVGFTALYLVNEYLWSCAWAYTRHYALMVPLWATWMIGGFALAAILLSYWPKITRTKG